MHLFGKTLAQLLQLLQLFCHIVRKTIKILRTSRCQAPQYCGSHQHPPSEEEALEATTDELECDVVMSLCVCVCVTYPWPKG